jgi:GrpB-like predicted nucleotidyltransferase (UPF0157 family)
VTALGLTKDEVQLVETDPSWAIRAAELGAELRTALGSDAVAVEHVGSTAVPGTVAKPILDLVVGLAGGADPDRVRVALESRGYEFRPEELDDALFFVLSEPHERRIAHVHVVVYGDPRWRGFLRVRDRLLADAAVRDAYAGLKRELAIRFPHDRASYTAAKAAFIRSLLAPASGLWPGDPLR